MRLTLIVVDGKICSLKSAESTCNGFTPDYTYLNIPVVYLLFIFRIYYYLYTPDPYTLLGSKFIERGKMHAEGIVNTITSDFAF